MTRILISGASVAGPALAYWLDHFGFDVTVVELAPGVRPGGQAVDVRGPALDVAERMGLLGQIRANAIGMRGMSMVDAEGAELFRTTERTITGGDLASPDVEILRDDLARIIIDATDVEYLFGDTITAIEQDATGARVSFREREARTFDLVIGADGLHSTVRKLVFGPEERFRTRLGSYLAVWTAPNFLGLDRWQVFHQVPGGTWGGGMMSVRGNTEARVYVGFESAEPPGYDHRDVDAQKRLLAERFATGGWELPRMLEYMWQAPDFHLDEMSQIHLDTWSRGRVALVGDAGYCGSPFSGQGTSMALVGAYVLAGELKAAGDHVRAFAAYERELRDYVTANQELALTNRARVEAEMAADLGEPATPPDAPDFDAVVTALHLKTY